VCKKVRGSTPLASANKKDSESLAFTLEETEAAVKPFCLETPAQQPYCAAALAILWMSSTTAARSVRLHIMISNG